MQINKKENFFMREFTTCFSGLRDCLPLHLSWVQYFVLFGPSAWFPFKFCLYYFFKIKFGLWSVADNGFSITAYQLCKPPQAGSLRRLLGVGGLKLTRLLRLLRLLLLANHFFFSGKVLLLWWKQYWRSQESRTQKQKMWIFYPSGWHGSDTSPEIHLYYRHGTSPL